MGTEVDTMGRNAGGEKSGEGWNGCRRKAVRTLVGR